MEVEWRAMVLWGSIPQVRLELTAGNTAERMADMVSLVNQRYAQGIMDNIFPDGRTHASKDDVHKAILDWFDDKYIEYWTRDDIDVYVQGFEGLENRVLRDKEWMQLSDELSDYESIIGWDEITESLHRIGVLGEDD